MEQPRQATDPGRRTVELCAVASPNPRNSEDGVRFCKCFSSASSSSSLNPPLCGYAKCHVTLIVAPTGSVVIMSLLGIPQGPLVRPLSRKSRSYRLAGGNVRATCPRHGGKTRAAAKAAAIADCSSNEGPRMAAGQPIDRNGEPAAAAASSGVYHTFGNAAQATKGSRWTSGRTQIVDALLRDHSGRRHAAGMFVTETLVPGGHDTNCTRCKETHTDTPEAYGRCLVR